MLPPQIDVFICRVFVCLVCARVWCCALLGFCMDRSGLGVTRFTLTLTVTVVFCVGFVWMG